MPPVEKKKKRKKRRGAGFIWFFLLPACAGTAFFVGWLNFRLEEGEYGVIHTKTGGYSSRVVEDGVFNWNVEALLPTNLTLHKYNLSPVHATISRTGSLPSSELYAALLPGKTSFNWTIRAGLTYSLKPQALPQLAEEGQTDLENLCADYESRLGSVLNQFVSDMMLASASQTAADDASGGGPVITPAQLESRLADAAGQADSRFEIRSLTLAEWQLPDLALYGEARKLTLNMMSDTQAVLTSLEETRIRRDDIEQARLSLLERYGSILSEHPVLLELFALEGNPAGSLLPPPEIGDSPNL